MGERKDVKRGERGAAFTAPGRETAGKERSPEEIRADITRTRAEMDETVGAIQERLSPEHIKNEVRKRTIGRIRRAGQQAGSRAKDFGSTIVDTIRSNPVPAAMVGVGLSWIIMKQRSRGNGGNGSGYAMEGSVRTTEGEFIAPSEEFGEPYETSAEESRLRSKAKEITGKAQEKAGQLTTKAREKAGRIGSAAQERARQARGYFQGKMETNLLGVGAIMFALGAIVGLSIPESSKEEELMGEASERLMTKARGIAQETMQKARGVAEEAGRTAQEAAERHGVAP